jgi:hypothetical protein
MKSGSKLPCILLLNNLVHAAIAQNMRIVTQAKLQIKCIHIHPIIIKHMETKKIMTFLEIGYIYTHNTPAFLVRLYMCIYSRYVCNPWLTMRREEGRPGHLNLECGGLTWWRRRGGGGSMHIELAFELVFVVPINKLVTTLWVQNVIIGGTKRARTSSCGLL